MNKNFKIWGVSFSLIGDLIVGLPQLTYFEKKYPGSYKYWGIHKKMSHAAPLFYNHPLIDRIKITDKWGEFGKYDYELASKCDITTRDLDSHNKTLLNARPEDYWYNDHDIVEQMARMSGIYDIKEVLTEDELRPQLYQWFDADFDAIQISNHISDCSGLPKLITSMKKNGYDDTLIQKICFENWLNLLKKTIG